MTPYYDRDSITVYHAKWEDVVAAGLVPVQEVALVHADPPYGTRMGSLQRGRGGERDASRVAAHGAAKRMKVRHFAPLTGDDAPFDPAALLALARPTVLWGANHYADRVPGASGWLAWDKREDVAPDDGSDAELAWTNLGGALRMFRHFWRGALRKTEKESIHIHPTQKPIALCSWVYQRAKLKRGDLVFVPYMGSGPDLAACVAMGLRCIAVDVSEDYCRVAVGARLHAAPKADNDELPLFAGRTA